VNLTPPVNLTLQPFVDLGFARFDTQRELRQGAPEAVLGEGKTPDEVCAIVAAALEAGVASVLVTRASPEVRAALAAEIEGVEEDERARCSWVVNRPVERYGRIAMVSAGTSDGCVLHEARIRAQLIGCEVTCFEDVGVAGLHRLAAALPAIAAADCVVVAAGMDGALASVVGGLASVPVIGVPTSVGYGSADAGRTALNAMLSSCAAGLAVVGIDDGFGAGTVAAMIARSAARAAD
jgi:pyridinium-3,5-biscarboxylic acid mononucleotide synthase